MSKVKLSGREYSLRMDLHAMEKMEDAFGDLQEALKKFRSNRSIKTIKTMFVIMANSGERKEGRPESVTGADIDDISLLDLDKLAVAMNLAMEEAMHAETVGGGAADDDRHDVYGEMLEAEEKNG